MRSRCSLPCFGLPCSQALAVSLVLTAIPGTAGSHPADTNQDNRISLIEVTEYARAFADQTPWPAGPSPIPEDYYLQARFIWQHGEQYREIAGAPLPRAWVPAPADGTFFVALAEGTPFPLDFVEVLGLPDGATNLYAEFQVPGQTDLYYSGVRALPDERWELLVPITPGSSDGGGRVTLNLRQDDLIYPVGPIVLAALPAAPGTTAGLADELELLGAAVGKLAGVDLSTFFDVAQSTIPSELRPFVALDKIVRNPSNPDNLANILRGTAPLLEEIGVYNPDLADRIWAKWGVGDELRQLRLGFDQAAAVSPLDSLRAQSGHEREAVTDSVMFIDTLARLSALMREQCQAQTAGEPGSEGAKAKAGFGYATSAIGLMGPLGAAFSLGANATLFVFDTYQQAEANVLPAQVPTFELILTTTEFTEDFCTIGYWEAYLSARSKGWSLDKTIIQGLYLAASSGRDIAGLAGVVARNEKLRALSDDLLDGADKILGHVIDGLFPGDTSVVTVPPSTWENIPINREDLNLVIVSYPGDVIQEHAGDPMIYEPANVGSGGLKVETVPGTLGCEAQQGRTVLVEVLENKITLTPSGGQARPGEEISFTATITDAFHRELEWHVNGGTIVSQMGDPESGVHTMIWKAPPNDFPSATISVRSPTTFCLREGVVRERTAIIEHGISELILVPDITCLQHGGLQTFTVLDSKLGEVPDDLKWTLVGPGSLNASGNQAAYAADGEGAVTIRVTTAEDPPRVLEQSFAIGDCYVVQIVANFTPAAGWTEHFFGNLNLTDTDQAGEPWALEGYFYDGLLFLDQAGPDRLKGALSGLGFTPRFPQEFWTDPENFDDGSRTFHTSSGGFDYELALFPRIGFRESDTTQTPAEYISDGRLRVYLFSDSGLSGSWPTDIEIVRHEWSFDDGTRFTGEEVAHTFEVGPRFDHQVTLTIVDSAGHTASFTQDLRFIDFIAEFDVPFDPDGPASCFNFPIPGFEPDCSGSLRVFGPRAGESSLVTSTAVPQPDAPGRHALQLAF